MSSAKERREARKAELEKAREAQCELDYVAIDDLEVQHGDSNIAVIEVPFTPGLPVCCAVRCPSPIEIKRYRDTIKPKKNGEMGDAIKAAEDLGSVCVVYPDKDLFAKVLEARAGVLVQLGAAAVQLAVGSAEAKGKD